MFRITERLLSGRKESNQTNKKSTSNLLDFQLGQIKKIPVFRVTRPYLNWLVKPIIFFAGYWKNIILCILKGKTFFKMHKILFFFPENKKIYVPTIPKIFRPITRNTLIFLFRLIMNTVHCLYNAMFGVHWKVPYYKWTVLYIKGKFYKQLLGKWPWIPL